MEFVYNSEFNVERNSWPDKLPRKLEFPEGKRPLPEYIKIRAEKHPEKPAVSFYGETLSWEEVNKQIDSFAQYLKLEGYETGEVCALYLQNCPQFFIAYFGAQRAGMVVTPVNPQFKPHGLEYQLSDSEASILLTHSSLLENVKEIREETELEEVIATLYSNYAGSSSPIPLHSEVKKEPPIPEGYTPFIKIIEEKRIGESFPKVEMDDLALLQYTGGTTGMPKGCKHTHWNTLFKGATSANLLKSGYEDVILGVMPIFHVAGKLLAVDSIAASGAQVVFLPRFSPEQVIKAIDEYQITFTWLAIPIVQFILVYENLDEYDLTSLSKNRDVTLATSFGSTISKDLSDKWERLTGTKLKEASYGLSETHTMDTNTMGDTPIEPGFVGQPNWGVEIEIRDFETNETLESGDEGEIVIKTPSMMEGYLNKPEQTEEEMEPDGFLHTGDIGRMNEDGYLYFLGRRKDTIKVSGHTTAPKEIENLLKQNDYVKDVIIVGKPHETRGHVLEAHVVPTDESVSEKDIISWVEGKLAEYKVPKSVKFVDSLPKTDVGKVDRVAYHEELHNEYA